MNGLRAATHHRECFLSKPLADGKSPMDVWVPIKSGAGKFLRKEAHHIERQDMKRKLTKLDISDSDEDLSFAVPFVPFDWMYWKARQSASVHATATHVYFNRSR
ncbi:MAG: hypothetical protein NT155_00840 [Candidatus Staskawiczbacteria bacterium]|nr:hypothetical protein [Candidatus Staskawiczbacteria bacterium]